MISGNRVIRVINKVNDNIWVGDLKEALSILRELQKERDLIEAGELYRETLRTYREICKELKNKFKGKEYHSMVVKTFRERLMQHKEFNIDRAILGAFYENATQLLIQLEECIRMEKEGEIKLREVIKRKFYKYSIIEYGMYKYEVRVLLEKSIEEIDAVKLKEQLRDMGYRVGEPVKALKDRYLYLTAFSQEGYIEIMVNPPRITILISFIEPDMEAVKNICEKMVECILT